jgi:hypothetical protein
MSFAEYARLRHPTPYVLRLARGEARLVVFGVRHGSDPADPMLADLERAFDEVAPAMALHEGTPPTLEALRETAIRKHCEAGLVCFLAARAGVPLASLDLPIHEEAKLLAARLGPGDALVFLVARQLASFNRKSARMDMPTYFAEFFELIGPALGLPGLDWPRVEAEHRRVFGAPLERRAVTSELTDPLRRELTTQRIATWSNRLRDRYVLGYLLDAVAEHGRVFAAIGVTHAVMLEPALWAAGLAAAR